MKYFLLLLFPAAVFFCSCGAENAGTKQKTVLADTAEFYPLYGFFSDQIEYVDLRNFNIYRLSITDGKKDSVAISKEEFAQWAGIVKKQAFADPSLKAAYKETVFEDLSTNSYTINYTPHNPDEVTVKNIDILLAQETNTVKRVFIKSRYIKGDTTIEEQCNWKADKSFQVNRVRYTKNGFRSTELNYINWNDF